MALYPGADGSVYYADLEQFLAKASRKLLTSEVDVGRYHRQFASIANRLIANNQMNEEEARFQYRKGFSVDLMVKIEGYFLASRRTGYNGGVYSRDEIYDAALQVKTEARYEQYRNAFPDDTMLKIEFKARRFPQGRFYAHEVS
ncbi:hypothetical protein B0H17DRAFT_1269636 [Mycena rosella]|uniref:Uncharacterized protein n=1 Tax=Mycena rosella TaxID=1033263 RepID=A0AAD7CP25_MYCRO|nr:hypothetical protein B0H17DRAFT_1269636 [Mycena rosella]